VYENTNGAEVETRASIICYWHEIFAWMSCKPFRVVAAHESKSCTYSWWIFKTISTHHLKNVNTDVRLVKVAFGIVSVREGVLIKFASREIYFVITGGNAIARQVMIMIK